jgi:hypothetical protein
MPFDLHTLLYAALTFAYFEAALQSVFECKHHNAAREAIVACLYASLALFI